MYIVELGVKAAGAGIQPLPWHNPAQRLDHGGKRPGRLLQTRGRYHRCRYVQFNIYSYIYSLLNILTYAYCTYKLVYLVCIYLVKFVSVIQVIFFWFLKLLRY